MEPERIAERVWPDGLRSLEPLGGGITNRNFKVTLLDGAEVVLRIGGKDTELLGIDRDNEHAATRAAADAGLAPEVIAFVEPEGYLVTRFVAGRPVPVDEVRTTDGPAGDRRRRCAACTKARRSRDASTRSAWSRRTARPPRRTVSPCRPRTRRRRRSPTGSSRPEACSRPCRATTIS